MIERFEPDRIPFPTRLVGWYDIAKGVGGLVIESILRMPRQLASHGDHFTDRYDTFDLESGVDHQLFRDPNIKPLDAPVDVQADAEQWVSRMGLGND